MKIFLAMLLWVINMILAVSWTDVAVISWYKTGVDFNSTLIVMLITSTVLICIDYCLLSLIFKGLEWLREKIILLIEKNFDGRRLNFLNSPRKILYEWLRGRPKEWGKKLAFWARSPLFYFLLFVLNLIPVVPYISLATIIAAKIVRLRWYAALTIILAGNALKILYWSKIVYTYF